MCRWLPPGLHLHAMCVVLAALTYCYCCCRGSGAHSICTNSMCHTAEEQPPLVLGCEEGSGMASLVCTDKRGHAHEHMNEGRAAAMDSHHVHTPGLPTEGCGVSLSSKRVCVCEWRKPATTL